MTDLHQEAARIIHKFNLKEGFIKNLVYSSTYRNLRQLFALVSESIKYQSILKDILTRSGSSLLTEELVNNDTEMAVVLLYEELVGAGFGRAGFVRKMMRKHKAEIKAAHDVFLKENNAGSLADVLNGNSVERKDFPVLPRYARVNLIKCTIQDAIDKLCEDGWEFTGKLHVDRFKEEVSALSEYQFGSDPLLNDVLVFTFNTDLHKDKLVVNGSLVLQERASCVPAHVLNPPPGSVVLDCCAAPGNKTSHLASLMGDQGQIIALDRDVKRVSTMKSLLQKAGTSCVETFAQDFLTLSPDSQEVSNITMILLDPSCSCTGMPTGTSYRQEVPIERLQSLKRYQISLLKHALRFPNVQRVVYSTCSTSRQENEEVVEEVMCKVRHCFNFVPVLPGWPNSRGMKKFLHHTSFLRVSPEEHLSAGFFVACFERIKKPMKPVSENSNIELGVSEIDVDGSEVHSDNGDTESVTESKKNNEFDEEHICQGSKKKKKKRKMENDSSSEDTDLKVKKKKRRKKNNEFENNVNDSAECEGEAENGLEVTENMDKKKRKKEKSIEDTNIPLENSTVKKKKKKKRADKDESSEEIVELQTYEDSYSEKSKKKKKKTKDRHKDAENPESIENHADDNDNSEREERKKKKKKRKRRDDSEDTE